jgi:hypothetical protein
MRRSRLVWMIVAAPMIAAAPACGGAIRADADAAVPVDASDATAPAPMDASLRDALGAAVDGGGAADTLTADAVPRDAVSGDAVAEEDAVSEEAVSVDVFIPDTGGNDPRCPSSYAMASGVCPVPGLACGFKDGICSCPPAGCSGNSCGGCTPRTCQDLGYECGPAGDGCGNLIVCGTCLAPSSCGGAGQPNLCGVPDGGSYDGCVPQTCASLSVGGSACGMHEDGCGGVLSCGACSAPEMCAGPRGVCTLPAIWSCNAQACPSVQPVPSGPCAAPGLTCTYSSPECCLLPVQCLGGVWQYPE